MADTIKQRIALDGGDAVKTQLEAIGEAGKKAFGDLKGAADQAGGSGKGLDSLRAKAGDLKDSFGEAGAVVTSFGARIASIASGAFATLAATFSASGITSFTVDTAKAIDSQVKLAETLGLTSKQLSGLKFAARNAGVDGDAFENSITRLTRSLEAAQQSGREFQKKLDDIGLQARRAQEDAALGPALKSLGPQVQAFLTQQRTMQRAVEDATRAHDLNKTAVEKLGVSYSDAAGNTRNLHDVILDVADVFKTLPDGPRKAAIAVELFGRGSARMVPFLNQGREGIIAFEKEAERIAPSIGAAAKAQATKLAETVETFDKAVTSLKSAVIAPLFEPVTKGLEGFTELVVKAREPILGLVNGLVVGVPKAHDSLVQFGADLASKVQPTLTDFFALLEGRSSDIKLPWLSNLLEQLGSLTDSVKSKVGPAFTELVNTIFPQVNKGFETATAGAKGLFDAYKEGLRLGNKAVGDPLGFDKTTQNTANASKGIAEIRSVLNDATAIAKKFNEEMAKNAAATQAAKKSATSFLSEGTRVIQFGQEQGVGFTASIVNATRANGTRIIQIAQETAQTVAATVDEGNARVAESFALLGLTIDENLDLYGQAETLRNSLAQLTAQASESANQFADAFISANERVDQSFQQLDDTASQTFDTIVSDAVDAGQRVADAFSDLGDIGFAGGGSVGHFASGGPVRGAGTSISDSIRAWLSNGEFVQPTRAVRHYGLAFMESIRRLQFPKFSMGGIVDRLSAFTPAAPRFADGGFAVAGGGNTAHFHFGSEVVKATLEDDMMDRLQRVAIKRQLHSAGRRPSYVGR